MGLLDKTIGIVGGGQLGKMMILDAKRLGFKVIVLDPDKNCPASSICDEQIVKSFLDPEGYIELAKKTDVITYEFEHINADILMDISSKGYMVYPSPHALKIIQNKRTQKELLLSKGIKTPRFYKVETQYEIEEISKKIGFPFMLKATTGGYDGKGNYLVESFNQISKGFSELGGGKLELIAEEFCPFIKEISVLSCRDLEGNIVVYPVAENIHKNSILDETIVPCQMPMDSQKKAMDMAQRVMESFSDVGMFCTEMFLLENGDVYLNEVAPRPHNSGHYTIEGCVTSQYENHIRAITGLPLGSTELRSSCVMRNILGDKQEGPQRVEGAIEVLNNPFVKLHIYGKTVSKEGRKMGHLTAMGDTVDLARERARFAYEKIVITGKEER